MSMQGILSQAGILIGDRTSWQFTGLGGSMGAKLFGAGTASKPAVHTGNGINFLQFYFRHDGVSGDNRGLYQRIYFNGGGGGDCARFFATVKADCGTVHGVHNSLSFDAGKQVSGQGIACRNTLHIPNDALSAGHIAALQAEAYMDGTAADPGSAQHGLIRLIVDGGDATAQARFKNAVHATIPAGAYDSGNMFVTTNGGTATHMLRAKINGTTVYFMMSTTPVSA